MRTKRSPPKPFNSIPSIMNNFFFTYIFRHKVRSLSLIIAIFLAFLTIFFGIYLHKNTENAISYYTKNTDNDARVRFSASSNLFSVFHTENNFNENLIEKIQTDPRLEKIQIFRLVNIPVMAKIGFLGFELESDVPVFSVTDSALPNQKNAVGISRTMLDLYNTQIAGSSQMFPKMKEIFLLGQNVEFIFGKSKIFQTPTHSSVPLNGKITTINNDFPAIGFTLTESTVREKMHEIGYAIGNPYRIIAYMKNPKDADAIKNDYQKIHLTFDKEENAQFRGQIFFIGMVFFLVGGFMISLFFLFFIFLLLGYFRERSDVFTMISTFGLKNISSYKMTLGEPLLFAFVGMIF